MKTTNTFRLAGLAAIALALGVEPASAQYVPPPQLVPGVDYSLPNYANSPLLTKFVDALPGFSPAGANLLGNYIPIAVPDTTTYAGSDYYEIALVDYTQRMHSELLPTKLRGYVQLSTTVVPGAQIPLFYADGVTPILINGVQAKGVDRASPKRADFGGIISIAYLRLKSY